MEAPTWIGCTQEEAEKQVHDAIVHYLDMLGAETFQAILDKAAQTYEAKQ